jgi:membrane associated rhomboid family serine protease
MFLVLPIRSDVQLRRWPVWTMVLIGLNALVWAATLWREHELERQLPAVAQEAAEILGDNPELQPSEELAYLIASHPRAHWRLRNPPSSGARGSAPPRAARELEAVEARASALLSSDLRHELAFGRGQADAFHAISSIFTHGSWGHLLFNAWFLWLTGIALEDKLGRIVYPIFYVAGGVVAGICQMLASSLPGIGASGAIAAVMGAFAMLLPLSRVYLRVVTLVPAPVTIHGRFGSVIRLLSFPPLSLAWLKIWLPAFLVLGLWGGVELWSGATTVASGVGHFAHAGGFGFGLVIAALLRVFGLDARLEQAIERQGSVVQNPALLAASELIDAGKPGVAIVRLRRLLEDSSVSPIDVQLELLRAAERANSRRDELAARVALLELYLRSSGPVAELFGETRAKGLDSELPAELRVRIDAFLAQNPRSRERTQRDWLA